MSRPPKLISLRDISDRLHKDVSYIRKEVDSLKLNTIMVQRKEDGKVISAITLRDYAKLLKSKNSLYSKPLSKSDVTLSDVADAIKVNPSYALRLIKKYKLNCYYRKVEGARSINCISSSDLEVLKKKTGRPLHQV